MPFSLRQHADDLNVTRIVKFWNMLSPEGILPLRQRRQGRIILLTLIAAITVDKLFVNRELPEVSAWVTVNPMPVFLDIPADLSLGFDVVPVAILFPLLYGASLLPYRYGKGPGGGKDLRPSLWKACTALFIVPCWMLSGSLLYRLVEGQLSKPVRNAIESFGITADIHSFLPGHEFVRLRGSLVMFVFLFPGLYFCNRWIRRQHSAGMFTNAPIPVMSSPVPPPTVDRIPASTSCTEITPVTISPVRIHIQYPKPQGPDC